MIYGPTSGPYDGVNITMDNSAEIYGGLVGSVDEVKNGIGLHFDEALVGLSRKFLLYN